MEKALPVPSLSQRSDDRSGTHNYTSRRVVRGLFILLALLLVSTRVPTLYTALRPLPPHATTALSRCRSLSLTPGPSADFHRRKESDRFVPGTKPYLLKNAKIWTGAENGTEVIRADILLDKGIIKSIGHVGHSQLTGYTDVVTVDLKGAWVTPGYVLVPLEDV